MHASNPPHRSAPLLATCIAVMLLAGCTLSTSTGMKAYENGDHDAARSCWEPMAMEGHAEAQFLLGTLYENGEGLPVDQALAFKWYSKAAEQGYGHAQNNLGLMHYRGRHVPRDLRRAEDFFRMAAEQDVMKAQRNLGILYLAAKDVPDNLRLAEVNRDINAVTNGNDNNAAA